MHTKAYWNGNFLYPFVPRVWNLGSTLPTLGHPDAWPGRSEVCGRPNVVDVLRHMLRERVPLVTSDLFLAGAVVLIDVVLSAEDMLSLCDSDVEADGSTRCRELDLVRVKAMLGEEPAVDSVYGILGWPECLCYLV